MQVMTLWRGAFIAFGVLLLSAITAHMYLLDGLPGWSLSRLLAADTIFTSGYSDTAFRKVRSGMSEEEVRNLLGSPMREGWYYDSSVEQATPPAIFFDANGAVTDIWLAGRPWERIVAGSSREAVLAVAGEARRKLWWFSRAGSGEHYSVRAVVFEHNRVVNIVHEFYMD